MAVQLQQGTELLDGISSKFSKCGAYFTADLIYDPAEVESEDMETIIALLLWATKVQGSVKAF